MRDSGPNTVGVEHPHIPSETRKRLGMTRAQMGASIKKIGGGGDGVDAELSPSFVKLVHLGK